MAFNTTIPMSLSYRCYGEEVNTPPPLVVSRHVEHITFTQKPEVEWFISTIIPSYDCGIKFPQNVYFYLYL